MGKLPSTLRRGFAICNHEFSKFSTLDSTPDIVQGVTNSIGEGSVRLMQVRGWFALFCIYTCFYRCFFGQSAQKIVDLVGLLPEPCHLAMKFQNYALANSHY